VGYRRLPDGRHGCLKTTQHLGHGDRHPVRAAIRPLEPPWQGWTSKAKAPKERLNAQLPLADGRLRARNLWHVGGTGDASSRSAKHIKTPWSRTGSKTAPFHPPEVLNRLCARSTRPSSPDDWSHTYVRAHGAGYEHLDQASENPERGEE
jgi:hypothetical protein